MQAQGDLINEKAERICSNQAARTHKVGRTRELKKQPANASREGDDNVERKKNNSSDGLAAGCILISEAALARYTGSGPACVSGVAQDDRLNVRSQPFARSRILGSLGPGQCGMNIEAVKGTWTFIRGNDRGRNIQGWVNNRFLRAKDQGGQAPQSTGNGSGFPIRAASGGGIVRGGPGTNYRQAHLLAPIRTAHGDQQTPR